MSGVMSGSAMEGSGEWTATYNYSGSGMMDVFFDNVSRAGRLTCQQRRALDNPLPLSITATNALRYIQFTYYMICYPIAFLLNAFVIFIIARFKKLHDVTFYLALQIIIANLANIIFYCPHSTANAIANRNAFAALCSAMGFLTSFLLSARNLLVFVLVADRFFLIFLPFWYARHRVKVVIPLSIGGWMIALIISLIPLISLYQCYALQRFTWVCQLGRGCDMPQCNAYHTFTTALTNVGTLIAFFFYLALYRKARKLQKRVTVSQSNESAEDREAAKQNRIRERRANTTFLILFTALVGVTLPSFLFFIFGRAALVTLNIAPPPAFTIIAVIMGSLFLLIFIVDPIVIMRNQDVREVIQTIIAKIKGRVAPSDQTNQTETSN